MLTVIEKVIFLQNVEVFTDIPTEQLAYLAAIAEEATYQDQEVIYREQDPADSLYLVVDGRVGLHRGGQEITVAGPQEGFGTWALFDEEIRLATATAQAETKLLRIEREDFYDLLADHVQITQAILKSLSRRLRGLIGRIGPAPAGTRGA